MTNNDQNNSKPSANASDDSVLVANFFERYQAVEGVVEESRTDGDYYLFLSFGAFIATLGLLIDNPVVIIGAMLVAPILFPIMSMGMGIVTSSRKSINRSMVNLGKSIAVIVGISFITAFVFNPEQASEQLQMVSSPSVIFFLVALFSGVVASFAWVKQEHSGALPGVAITVSLLPPLSATGIAVAQFSRDIFAGSLVLFLLNLVGIMFASVVVFSLFGFSGLKKVEEKKIKEEERQQAIKENDKTTEGSSADMNPGDVGAQS